MYSIDFIGNITRDSDGATIPVDANNIDYHSYLTWLAAGNTPQPYEPPIIDPKEQAKAGLDASDKEMARIAEDLISALIAKGVISESDLPTIVIDKLVKRKQLRDAIKM